MATLTRNFGRNAVTYRQNRPLTDAEMRHYAPSIFTTEAHESRSERYAHIPTVDVLRGLQGEGFQPFAVAQTRTRDEGHREYTKHMIRLRHASTVAADEANEIILLNSHNGASAYQMMAGMLRFVCTNGLVLGDINKDVRVRHTGNVHDDVIEGAYEVLGEFELIEENRDEMKALELAPRERQIFAEAARIARWGDPTEDPKAYAPVAARQLLDPKRSADGGNDLWSTFNVVQENLTKGGMRGRTRTNGRTRTRPVNSVTNDVKLNRALWHLSQQMREEKNA
ncbi:DUF932 domain-containing protein [Nocardia carnea]|uniref:DUF932 domain-containing protein n=1 Tax=Nocardia carnea TaxID=37328 RepID=UPI002458C693|nr:DUF932 domain-containing protein [Nocardia carnea]